MTDFQLFIISLNLLGIIFAIWGGAIIIANALNKKDKK